jgi:hypothetical protein
MLTGAPSCYWALKGMTSELINTSNGLPIAEHYIFFDQSDMCAYLP